MQVDSWVGIYILIANYQISDPTGKRILTLLVVTSVSTKLMFVTELVQKKTALYVAMILALNQELGMRTTTENVETVAFTNLNSVNITLIPALKCTILVEKMTMADVLMTTREIATMNVVIGVFGAVNGQDSTTFHVGMNVCTGKTNFNIKCL